MPRKAMTDEEAKAAALALAEKESKKVRQRPDSTVQAEPGDNTKYINHNMMLYKLKPIAFETAEEVDERTAEYFAICSMNDMKPSVAGYALALGVSRKVLWEYVSGRIVKPDGVRNSLKRAYDFLNAQMEDYMQNGKIQTIAGIFLMKNSFGYTDKQEIEVAAKQDAESSPEELDMKYRDAIPATYTESNDEN